MRCEQVPRPITAMTGDLVKAMRACPHPSIVDGTAAGAGASDV